jgi:carbohydrate diacid regulator
MLTQSLAQEIASETTMIIGHNVMITDRDAIVLGNGDPSRIGTFHEASVEVVRTERARTHTAEQARRLAGVRPGITLPVMLDGTVVGTVGITGAPSRVRRFGLVVRSQTELMLRESSLLTSRLVREKAVTDLLRDIAHHDPDIVAAEQVHEAARDLGHDLHLRRVALVVHTQQPPALRTMRELFHHRDDIVGALGRSHVAVLHRLPRDATADTVLAAADRAAAALAADLGGRPLVGVGDPAGDIAGLRDSLADAMGVLALAAHTDATGVVPISDYRVEQLLAAVGVAARRRHVTAVLGPLVEQPDWDVLCTTLLTWAEQGFQLTGAAQRLHIHRNTLIYRLQKIQRITGRDLRDHRYALAVHLACLLHGPIQQPAARRGRPERETHPAADSG